MTPTNNLRFVARRTQGPNYHDTSTITTRPILQQWWEEQMLSDVNGKLGYFGQWRDVPCMDWEDNTPPYKD